MLVIRVLYFHLTRILHVKLKLSSQVFELLFEGASAMCSYWLLSTGVKPFVSPVVAYYCLTRKRITRILLCPCLSIFSLFL